VCVIFFWLPVISLASIVNIVANSVSPSSASLSYELFSNITEISSEKIPDYLQCKFVSSPSFSRIMSCWSVSYRRPLQLSTRHACHPLNTNHPPDSKGRLENQRTTHRRSPFVGSPFLDERGFLRGDRDNQNDGSEIDTRGGQGGKPVSVRRAGSTQ
jgi:hypothetical protein